MKIISKRRTEEFVEFQLVFYRDESRSSAYSFPCTEDGKVLEDEMHTAALDNYHACLAGDHKVLPPVVEKREWRYRHPAVGECEHCGEEVELSGFTNTCFRCGTDYNSSGQRLADRSQWGEETNESLSDILMIP